MTNMMKLSDRHVIEHGRTIPKNLNQLNESEGSNLATAKFKLILPRQVQVRVTCPPPQSTTFEHQYS